MRTVLTPRELPTAWHTTPLNFQSSGVVAGESEAREVIVETSLLRQSCEADLPPAGSTISMRRLFSA